MSGYFEDEGGGSGGGVAISAGTQTQSTGTLIFQDGGGISFGLDNGTLTATVAGGAGVTPALSGSNGSFSFSTATFGNLNGISFYTSNGSMVASHNALTSQSNQAFSADASSTFQTLTFQDSNGVSFSNNGGALRVTHALQFTSNTSAITSNAMHSTSRPAFSADASSTFQTLTLQNSNGISFSNNAGAVRITHDLQFTSNTSNIPRLTVSDTATSLTITRLAFTQSNGITMTLSTAAGGATVIGSHNGLTTQSGQAFSADASSTFQTLTFQNSNGISFSNNAGALRVTHDLQFTSNTSNITSNALHSSQSKLTIYAGSNTTGATSGTVNSNSVMISGAGIASVQATNGGWLVSVPAGGGAGDGGNVVGVSTAGNTAGNTGTTSTGTMVFEGSNSMTLSQISGGAGIHTMRLIPAMSQLTAGPNISLSTNGSTITISGLAQSMSLYATGNTTLSSSGTMNLSSMIFRGSNNVSIGISNGSIVVDATAGGGAGATLSRWHPDPSITAAGSALAQSSCSIVPFILPENVAASQVMFPINIALASTSNTSSAGLVIGMSYVLYTRNDSTLSWFNSGSFTTSSFHQSNSTTVLAGPRLVAGDLATASTFTAGEYWMAVHFSTTSSGQTNLAKTLSMAVVPTWATVFGALQHFTGGVTTNTRAVRVAGAAIHSTGATRASIGISDITGNAGNSASLANLWFELRNYTIW